MRRFIFGTIVIAASIAGFATSADAAHNPTVVLSQTTGVQSGQKLVASGAHWVPGSAVDGTECAPRYTTVGLVACNRPAQGTATSGGRVRFKVPVFKGSVGSVGYACRSKCLVVFYEQDDTAMSAYAKFTFAP
jgi:hypothetical protein